MNGTEIVALEVETRAAHRAYLEAAALLDPPANIEALALKSRGLLNRMASALLDYKGDGL